MSGSTASPAAMQLRPALVAFDLDATLWYPEMYMLSGPPFKLSACKTAVIDRGGDETRLMGDARAILAELATSEEWQDVHIAYCSRTDMPHWAATHLKMFEIADGLDMHTLAHHQEIYPGSKKKHFTRIQERTGIDFKDCLFFDDDMWNIREVGSLGVTCIYTPNGLTRKAWEQGLREHAERRRKAAKRRAA